MSADESKNEGKNQHENDVQPPSLESSEAAGQPVSSKEAPTDKLPKWKDAQWWQVWVQLFLFPVGIWALVIYHGQLDEMRNSTNVATKAVKAAQATTQLDQRAWLSVGRIQTTPTADQPLGNIDIPLMNTGKTYAKNIKGHSFAGFYPIEKGIPDFDNIVNSFEDSGPGNIGLLAPGGTLYVNPGKRHDPNTIPPVEGY